MGKYNEFLFGSGKREEDLEYIEDVRRLNTAGRVGSTGRIGEKYEPFRPVKSRAYSSLVIYEPETPEDVETLINHLKRGEPAIVNLDKPAEAIGQRILDMVSGAVFALNGSMHRIRDNLFLLTPEGVEIADYTD